jgi:hypothetical protein
MESVVRTSPRAWGLGILGLIATLSFLEAASAASIEAQQGREYRLTKRNGPWMIMVASFHEPPPEAKTSGMSPEEAAAELVMELRRAGIPAYTYVQEEVAQELPTSDRASAERRRVRRVVARQGGICVLAGNYQSSDDATAQRTLDIIKGETEDKYGKKVPLPRSKRFNSKVLGGDQSDVEAENSTLVRLKNGGVFRKSTDRETPEGEKPRGDVALASAFLTSNPMLSPEEVRGGKRDALLAKLNSGNEYSLLENEGKYTVVVATFFGKSGKAQLSDAGLDRALENFQVTNSLDEAGKSAWELCRSLRNAKSVGYDQNFEAFIYHDRYHSYVTIGAFDSKSDPRIAQLVQTFGAKTKEHEQTRQNIMLAEYFTIPRHVSPGQQPERSWIFDPQPRVVDVPR